MLDHWTKNARGKLIVFPMLSFEMGILAGSAVALRLRFARSEAEISKPKSLQLSIGPHDAIEFAKAITRAAEKILEQRGKGLPS